MAVLLDTGPLGIITNPRLSTETVACGRWVQRLLARDTVIYIPESADYELRRELIRARKRRGLLRLDSLKLTLRYLPITTDAMQRAAELWAQARQQGQPTADDRSLDADVILAAQAIEVRESGEPAVVATTNRRHLTRFVDARLWTEIG